jgi:hypothetical protein
MVFNARDLVGISHLFKKVKRKTKHGVEEGEEEEGGDTERVYAKKAGCGESEQGSQKRREVCREVCREGDAHA